MISVSNLTKTYKTPQKSENILKNFFARSYKEYTAVNNISFEIGENELVGFIGPNGAGKTTTLKMLSGILYPTSGSVEVLGYTPFDKKYAFLKQIGFVMGQKNQLLWDLPATDSFLVNKEIYEISDKTYKKTLNELIELLDCKDFIDQPVKTLSLGQRMRVEFIAALLHKPKVLFLDEPTIGLDIFAQSTIRTFIKQYQEMYKSSIMLTSHYMQDVQFLAKRVILIDRGNILFDDTLEKLIATYSQEKIITITVGKEYKHLPNVITEHPFNYTYPQIAVTVKKEDLPRVLSQALRDLEYVDVTVENEPIEEVLKKSFSSAS